ncbi:unnamed protein product [Chrysoparadoxa australica]
MHHRGASHVTEPVIFHGRDEDVKAKLKLLDVHPVLPWLVAAADYHVVVWDYIRGECIKSFVPSDILEVQLNVAACKRMETVGGMAWPRSKEKESGKETGPAKAVKFWDRHVSGLRWSVSKSNGGNNSYSSDQQGGVGGRKHAFGGLVLACELCVMLIDLSSLAAKQITPEQLKVRDTKYAITAVELVSSTLLAIGGTDGCIKIFDCSNAWQLVSSLRGHKDKAAITQLLTAHARAFSAPKVGPRLRLVSRAEDGQFLFWEAPLDPGQSGLAQQSPQPRVMERGKEDRECASMFYTSDCDTVSAVSRGRRTASEARVLTWQLGTEGTEKTGMLPLLSRLKVGRTKGMVATLDMVPVQLSTLPCGALLSCGKDSKIYIHGQSCDTDDNGKGNGKASTAQSEDRDTLKSLTQIDLSDLIPAVPSADKLKLYTVAEHPQQRHLIACGSNAGLFMLRLQAQQPTQHACHVSWRSHDSKKVQVLSALHGGGLVKRELALRGAALSEAQDVAAPSPKQEQQGLGRVELLVHHSGRHAAVMCHVTKSFRVVSKEADGDDWREVGQGEGIGFAWCGFGLRFAVIRGDKAVAMEVSEGKLIELSSNALPSQQPLVLWGGLFLCVGVQLEGSEYPPPSHQRPDPLAISSLKRASPSGGGMAKSARSPSLASTSSGPVVTESKRPSHAAFYTWGQDDLQLHAVTSPVTAPSLIAWSEDGHRCAMVRGTRVMIYTFRKADGPSSRDDLELVCNFLSGDSLSDRICSAMWSHGSLLYSTTAGVWVACCLKDRISRTLLASHRPPAPSAPGTPSSRSHNLLEDPVLCPPGPIQVLGLAMGDLLCVADKGRGMAPHAFTVPLNSGYVRVAMLLAAGHVSKALEWCHAMPKDSIFLLAELFDMADQRAALAR